MQTIPNLEKQTRHVCWINKCWSIFMHLQCVLYRENRTYTLDSSPVNHRARDESNQWNIQTKVTHCSQEGKSAWLKTHLTVPGFPFHTYSLKRLINVYSGSIITPFPPKQFQCWYRTISLFWQTAYCLSTLKNPFQSGITSLRGQKWELLMSEARSEVIATNKDKTSSI